MNQTACEGSPRHSEGVEIGGKTAVCSGTVFIKGLILFYKLHFYIHAILFLLLFLLLGHIFLLMVIL